MNPKNSSQGNLVEQEIEFVPNLSSCLSRRNFLRILGVGAIGAVTAGVTMPRFATSALATTESDLAQARAIAASSPLYNQALAELALQGFTFDLFQADPNPLFYTSDPNTIGLELRSISPQPAPSGHSATMIMTIHLDTQILSAVYFVTGYIRPLDPQNSDRASYVELREVLLAVNAPRLARSESHTATGTPPDPARPATEHPSSCTSSYYRYGPWYQHSYGRLECHYWDDSTNRCRPRVLSRYHTRRRSAYHCVQGTNCPERCEYVCEVEDTSFTHEHPCSDWGYVDGRCP